MFETQTPLKPRLDVKPINMNNNSILINLLQKLSNKKLRITSNNGISYIASNVKVVDSDSVTFTDKFGSFVWLSISQITGIVEVKK